MTLKEFAALKVGDKITNPMSSSAGEVTAVDDKGVHVRWGNICGESPKDSVTRHYSVASTIWMHWSAESAVAPDSATIQA